MQSCVLALAAAKRRCWSKNVRRGLVYIVLIYAGCLLSLQPFWAQGLPYPRRISMNGFFSMNLPSLTCSPSELCLQPNYILLEKTLPCFSCVLKLLFAVFPSYCHFFYGEMGLSSLRLSWLHRYLLSLISAVSFPQRQILAAIQNLVYNFNYPRCFSLKLFQLFSTLCEMRGPQEHAMFNMWEQAIVLHSSVMMLSFLFFIPFLEIPSTIWICFSYCFWELSSILTELTILSPRSWSSVVTVSSEQVLY